MKWRHWFIFFCVFVLALWLWPSLVHEQLHRLALRLQGIDGMIHYDFSFPSHPSVTKVGAISSVAGGLLFLLLPSVVSLLFLSWLHLVLPKVDWHDWEIAAHGLILYLIFDLIVNLKGFQSVISDFHFLAAISGGKLIEALLIISLCVWGVVIVWQSRDVWWEHE